MSELDGPEQFPTRVRIGFDQAGTVTPRDAGTPLMTTRAAALLVADQRIPLPASGLTAGSGQDVDLTLRDSAISRRTMSVLPTENGHALVVENPDETVMLNGDPVVAGERRPLVSGDTIASDGAIVHYLGAGAPVVSLPKIEPLPEKRVRASKSSFLIGRNANADLVLEHPTVALNHARIVRHGDAANIEDTSGGLGIAVNGRRTTRARLAIGDTISIGPYRIVFDGVELHSRGAANGLPVSATGVYVAVESGLILQPTTVALHPGELVAVIGESGAGKSTLLKALAGVSPATGGEILVGGEPVAQRLPEIGYVPQFDIVHGALTVSEALGSLSDSSC